MGWLWHLKRNSDDRQKLVQLQGELDDISKQFRTDTDHLKTNSDEYRAALGAYGNDLGLVIAQIRAIETEQMLRKTTRWRVPVPMRPYNMEETEYWEWHQLHGRYYLTDIGLSRLQREVYHEWEMWSKPWLSWTAIAISVVSLIVAFARL